MSATPEQRQIIDAAIVGPQLVDAGAGTGKTFTLVERGASLVATNKLAPHNLLIVTFTHAAAAEIALRLDKRFADLPGSTRPSVGTFHQIATSLLREFAYDTGSSPDVRMIDDGRARGVFARAFNDLLHGRLGVDTSALLVHERTLVLERNLAGIALKLKNTNVSIDHFESEAFLAADALEQLPYGSVEKRGKRGKTTATWPRPNPPLTASGRHEEADRERRNVRAVATLFRRFDEYLAEENLLTFGDVLTRATAMLRNQPDITARLRERWLHAMVDEFQDTNSIQVNFLKALFGDDLRPVLAVGDVRQAIYAFNGADPEGIVRFRDMDGCVIHPLSENRRSYAEILSLAHDALAGSGAVAPALHQPLTAHRGDAPGPAVRMQLFSGDRALEREADAVAQTAHELVQGGASPRSIAVLMRSRSKAQLFAAALRRYGLAVQLHGGAGFFGTPEIREVVAWLRLVEEPDHIESMVVALQSAAIGLGDGVLATLAKDQSFVRAVFIDAIDAFEPDERNRLERFRKVARLTAALADVPLADAVRTVVLESGAEVARLAGDTGELDQARANLDKFQRLAADFATDRPTARISDFLRELDERAELDDDEAEAELEGERIALMTVHAAKGLEWDHVFVANVSPQAFPLSGGDAREVVVKFDEQRRALAFAHSPDGSVPLRWLLASNEVDEATGVIQERVQDHREEHRLFYVALTRARNIVYITGRGAGAAATPSACHGAVSAWLGGRSEDLEALKLVTDATAAFEKAELPALELGLDLDDVRRRLSAQADREDAPAPPALRRGPLSYTAIALYDACPRRSRYHYVFGLPDLGDEGPGMPADDDDREPGRRDPARFGRIVHLVLESAMLARVAGAPIELEDSLDAAMAGEDCSGDAMLREQAAAATRAAIAELAALTPIAAEERFDLEIAGVALNGYIDLLARDADGRLVIIDYKTGSTPSEHYAMQFALYRHAVGRQYPENASTQLLRIGAASAQLESIEPASEALLTNAISAAQAMDSDEPRPGSQCGTCPYAAVVCDAALMAVAS
jgi:DNA helicase-2/ATP-dependent DNA helicase PcrA